MSDFSSNWLIASQSARFVLRERTVALLAMLFVVLVLISVFPQLTLFLPRLFLG